MPNNTPDTFQFTDDDNVLAELPHVYGQAAAWIAEGMQDAVVTFDLVVREMPPHRNFLVFSGLEEMLDSIQKLRFEDHHIEYLLRSGLMRENTVEYLKQFHFRGDIWAMKEGSVFFPKEPVVRVTAPIIDAHLVDVILMNALSGNTIFSSKLVRTYLAAKGTLLATGGFRGHSPGAGARCMRASAMFGMTTASIPYFNKKFHVDSDGPFFMNAQHSFIKSFPDELSAMRALARQFPKNCSFMVDTYDLKKGVENAIIVATELRAQGHELRRVTVDSGDLLERSTYVRQELDRHGFPKVGILLISNLDEYKIEKLKNAGAPIEIYGTVTEVITSSDAPKLEVVYKMAQLEHHGVVRQTSKLSPGKESYPGVKQVYRTYDQNGMMVRDVIGLEGEQLGNPRLEPVMRNGKRLFDPPSFAQLHTYVDEELRTLPDALKDLHQEHAYPVDMSPRLQQMFEDVKAHHLGSDYKSAKKS